MSAKRNRPTTVAGRKAAAELRRIEAEYKKACQPKKGETAEEAFNREIQAVGKKLRQSDKFKASERANPTLNETLAPQGLVAISAKLANHPLFPVFMDAITQATQGKGVRHGGDATPFLSQPWVHYVKMHGRGFASGQAAKKLEEASSLHTGEPFEREVLGAMVYAGMAILKDRGQV